ncbi:GntR family transcriptional regulator [Salirhabdus sp. Marseille-P4669]|uniref:GntR family transcriptional regulator n=1 Tax=Salirhabdus sp. Marseille-P4669 TaxID=2042310 RepID=UPI000C7B902B|nr:GntR family transcriptional regulator [Salirhabdus sp. Marseille-P4669]
MNTIKEAFQDYLHGLEGLDQYRLPQRAYHILRLAIRDLILPPGSALLEREISEAFDMSRTPVREALVRLETEGLLELVPRRGFIVEPIEKEDLKEIYEIAESLEGLAVEMATKKVGQAELHELETIVVKQEEALSKHDLYRWAVLDDQFHSLLIDFSKSNRLRTVIDIHSDQLYRARLYTINHRPILYRSIDEHKAIIACMKAKDSKAARVVMESHRRRAQQEIIRALEEIQEKENA